MGFFGAIGTCYRKIFNFSDRARRKEYWYFFLFQILMSIAISVGLVLYLSTGAPTLALWLMAMNDPTSANASFAELEKFAAYYLWYSLAYFMLVWLPNLSVTVRRLHDTDHSGWLLLLPFAVTVLGGIGGVALAMFAPGIGAPIALMAVSIIPLVIYIYILVLLCLPGTNGNNRFGPDPVPGRKPREVAHPAFAAPASGADRQNLEAQRRAEIRELYRNRVLKGQKA